MTDMERLVFTVEEIAKILGISRPSAYLGIHNRQIPHIRIGQRILIPKKEFYIWLENPEVGIPKIDAGTEYNYTRKRLSKYYTYEQAVGKLIRSILGDGKEHDRLL